MVESRTYSILYFKSSSEATAFYNQFFATLPYLHGSQPIVTILLNVVQHINSCHLPTSLGEALNATYSGMGSLFQTMPSVLKGDDNAEKLSDFQLSFLNQNQFTIGKGPRQQRKL